MASSEALRALVNRWGLYRTQHLLLAAEGVKPGIRLKLNRESLPAIFRVAKDLGLFLVTGHDTIKGESLKGRSGYSEWSKRCALRPNSRGDCYIYASRSLQVAQRLRRLDEGGSDTDFGIALGYPSCCVQSFATTRKAGVSRDPVLCRYRDESPISWYMNVSLVCFQLGILAHFPCNERCEESFVMAGNMYRVLFTLSPEIATMVSLGLATWVVHTDILGVAGFRSLNGQQTAMIVHEVTAVEEGSELGQILHPGTEVARLNGTLRIGNVELPSRHGRLFRFL